MSDPIKEGAKDNRVAVGCIALVGAEERERKAWCLFEIEGKRLHDEIEERYKEITDLEEAWAKTYAEVNRLRSVSAPTDQSHQSRPQ